MGARRFLERVVVGDERGAVSWIVRAALWPLSIIYCLGLRVYLAAYETGLRRRHRLGVPVVSVGNLTFGGTGKTPAVESICRALQAEGRRVAVVSRGHGGKARGCVVVSDGTEIRCGSEDAGDEPVQLARSLPGVAVIVGKDRRAAGELACSRFAPDLIVLDDGMQYWQLHRDVEIAIVDVRKPFGSGLVMPAGDLREPARGLRRAHILLVNTPAVLDPQAYNSVVSKLMRLVPEAAVFRCGREPADVRAVGEGASPGADGIKGRRVFAFCGIRGPLGFLDTLDMLRARVVGVMTFPDHYRYDSVDIRRIREESERVGAELLITTEKDAARLGDRAQEIDRLCTLVVRLEIEDIGRFTQHISERTNRPDSPAASEEAGD